MFIADVYDIYDVYDIRIHSFIHLFCNKTPVM